MEHLVLTLPVLIFVLFTGTATGLTFPYFAYGSNVYPPTMTALRRIECLDSTAAILPGYKLRFNIPGIPALEPSWACVEEGKVGDDKEGECVHGVLYTLTPQDFARISMSEGVPFGYQWKMVNVTPYEGDGKEAGLAALSDDSSKSVQAYTLVSNNPFLPRRDIPPSRAYRNLIIKGARQYKMDHSYVELLEAIPVGVTIGQGYVAKDLLEAAERRLEQSEASKQ